MTTILLRQTSRLCGFFLLFSSLGVQAQNVQNTSGNTNALVSINSRVDPASLGLNLTIQLGNYPGRQNNLPVVLRYNSKQTWQIKFSRSEFNVPQNEILTYTEPFYTDGWSSSLDAPYFDSDTDEYFDENGNGVDLNNYDMWSQNDPYYAVPRLRIKTSDGVSREFRRGDWRCEFLYGRPDWNLNILVGDFYTVDGSRLRYNTYDRTFISPMVHVIRTSQMPLDLINLSMLMGIR